MCGPTSAIGLEEHERWLWRQVKDRLRRPGHLAGLMRGFVGGEEVAVVVATRSDGQVEPVAVLVSAAVRGELTVLGTDPAQWLAPGRSSQSTAPATLRL